MRRYVSELLGTFILVLLGCGSMALGGENLGVLGVSLCFGLAVVAMYYAFGNISGCHINPAVSLAMYMTNKITLRDFWYYVLSQIIGAILGILALIILIQSTEYGDLWYVELGQNGYGDYSIMGISLLGALMSEVVLSFVFIIAVLGVISYERTSHLGGLIIGLAFTLVYIVSIPLTGGSINPARSLASAVFLGGVALKQVWVFIVGALAGSAIAATLWNFITKELP